MEILRDLFINGGEASRVGYTAIVLAISFFLSGLVGLEREFNGHTAGLRTHIIISVSATAIGILGMYYVEAGPFIWGAMILGLGYISGSSVAQTGKDVKGITTSSTVFLTGILGLVIGLGYIYMAIFITLIGLVVLIVLQYVEAKTSKRIPTVSVYVSKQIKATDDIVKISQNYGLVILSISSKIVNFKNDDVIKISICFSKAPKGTLEAFSEELAGVVNSLKTEVKVPRTY